MNATERPFRFPRSKRLLHRDQFNRVYGDGRSTRTGPLVVHALPNSAATSRIGISISRKVGNAVIRNRIKRRLRDAFRRLRQELPGRYDLVITVNKHVPLSQADYDQALRKAAVELHAAWTPPTHTPQSTGDGNPYPQP